MRHALIAQRTGPAPALEAEALAPGSHTVAWWQPPFQRNVIGAAGVRISATLMPVELT